MENYQLITDKILNEVSKMDRVPTLLLHSCCAPCSSYVLEYLANYFNITIFYYNPNISPVEEFEKRKQEQMAFIEKLSFKNKISFLEGTYCYDDFLRVVSGFENEKEGGARCYRCYKMRLLETVKLAKENSFDYFATTLSVSPYKNAKWLNEIGKELEEEFSIKYLYSDFKKRNGYKRSIELSSQYGLYRQDYCGCVFSKR